MKIKQFIKKNTSLFSRVSFCLLAVCAVIKLIAVLSAPFADFFNRYISSLFRAVSGYATAFIPFSLAETVIISAIPLAVVYIIFFTVKISSSENAGRHISGLLGAISLLLSMFIISFSIAYDVTPLEEKMQLDTSDTTPSELYTACEYALTQLSSAESQLTRDENGASVMPYNFSTLTEKLNFAYKKLYGEYDFLSPMYASPKPIALSKPMTYTHIAGVYTFFTGEANVNINYPHYIIAYTAAHEMAHQRGIAPEDEANFIAFLVCTSSDDPYLRYCGYAQIAEYLGNALYATDREKFDELLKYYPTGLLMEYMAYAEMFEEYSDNTAADISGAVNDAYLKSQGQSDGTRSYDLVTELATAYILKSING